MVLHSSQGLTRHILVASRYFRGTSTRDAVDLTNNVRKNELADFDYAGFVRTTRPGG